MENQLKSKAQEIVDLQLEYYNNHDLDGFCTTFSENVEVYKSDKLVAKGQSELRKYYRNFNYVAEVKNSIVHKNKVIYHEIYGKEGDLSRTCIAIYDVKYGRICKLQLF